VVFPFPRDCTGGRLRTVQFSLNRTATARGVAKSSICRKPGQKLMPILASPTVVVAVARNERRLRVDLSPPIVVRGTAGIGAARPAVRASAEQRLGRGAEQEVVDHLVLVGGRRDLGRQGKDRVEVADRRQIGLAGGEPILRRRALALGAMAVAARVVRDPAVAAILAALDMAAECGSGSARRPTSPGVGQGSGARHWPGARRRHGDERRRRPPTWGGSPLPG
jgi:hypothetical protein